MAIRPYRPYYLGWGLRPPSWTTNRRAWERGIEAHGGPTPPHEPVFVHRDYHPGNVLWRRGRVSGIVDWVSASRGGGAVDVGHCHVNLARRFGTPVADRFLERWQQVAGMSDYHPYWDLAAAVSMGSPGTEPPPSRGLDELIAQAVARL